MALVMLPCDLPWWPAVVKQLDKAALARNSQDLIGAMQRIHDMCNISLDPDEDEQDPDLFVGFAKFIDEDLGPGEREQMFVKTIPKIVERAKALRNTKPPQGLYFSLQQQGDHVEYSYGFASSLVANAFFSTYPKRTVKTHPTLGDFNFTNFFKYLHLNSQKIKLQSILQYFEFLETDGALEGRMLVSRQVMTSKQWLTIEDWLESNVPLCPLTIRHVGRLERVDTDAKVLHVCFASSRFGEGVLEDAISQETVHIATHPEMLAVILSVEALEDNEVLIVDGARHVSRINNPKQKATFESIPNPNPVTVCCMDADNYSLKPLEQFEEDNILREMNKSLLGFRQRHLPASPTETVSLDGAACPDGVKRGGSRGFVLRDETVDEDFLKASLEAEQKWLGKFKYTQQPVLQRKDTNNSSKYSFSTEYSSDFCSELEEVYEQLSKWLDDPIASDENHELEARDRAVIQFAGSLLRRALSESFAGVPVQEGEPQLIIGTNDVQQKHKLALAVRSLSLELARQRNKRQQSISDTEDQQEVEEEDFMDAFEVQESPKKVESKRNKWTINLTSLKELETLLEEESPTFSRRLQFPEINIKNIYSDVEGINNSIPGDSSPQDGGLFPVATGNWGCGSRLKGDPQLKLVIQWLAASLAGVPRLIYYTCGNPNLSKLDTVSRVLTDRRWTVGDLSTAMLRFAVQTLRDQVKGRNSLFDELIGHDKPSP
ncbi:Similar to Parg: Poly(ADP-ribose) glycohydrolase (Rattus norvegicus), partial [Cotesia congregata]